MATNLIRISAYSGKNCRPLEIKGLDPEKEEQEALDKIQNIFESWKVKVTDTFTKDDVLIVMDAIVEAKNGYRQH